jgi:hypothetical protein
LSGPALDGWLPIGVGWQHGRPEIDWCFVGRERLCDAFFEDTVRRLVARPFNRAFRRSTGAEVLESWAERRPGLDPSGFIFHMSRCGSTLAAQMLAARTDCIVLSEPAPFDSLLRPSDPAHPVDPAQHVRWLRALVSAMGQARTGDERHFVVKLDCWHTLSLALIRKAFPSVPMVFLYREPRAVLASHLRQRGVQTVPGLLDSRLFGIDFAEAVAMPAPVYCARVLGAICEAASLDENLCLVNYAQLPDAMFETILPRFRMPLSAVSQATMLAAAQRNSKHPEFEFSSADDAPPIAALGPIEDVVVSYMDPVYAALEQRRAVAAHHSSDRT